MSAYFVPNPAGIKSLYTGDSSPVVKDLRRRADRVALAAKLRVNKRSGRLAASISTRPTMYGPTGAPFVMVGSRLNYALLVHNGTRPHTIRPRRPGGLLVFTSRGRQVRTMLVRHPGTRPNPYLLEALPAINP